MTWPRFILFASDATLIALWAAGLLATAAFALFAEWRRARRPRVDAVGWMPWTALFLGCALAGLALLTLAIQGWARA